MAAKQAVRELHAKLEDLESGLNWHWGRSGAAKTASAGMAIASVILLATGVGAIPGIILGAGSAATGVGASIGDYVHEQWTQGGLKEAYEKAEKELNKAARDDPTLFWKIYAAIGNVMTLKAALVDAGMGAAQAVQVANAAEAAKQSGEVIRVGTRISQVLQYGEGGQKLITPGAAAGSGAVSANGVVAGAVVVSKTMVVMSVIGAVASSGIAIHSWATNPPSYKEVKAKREEVGKLLEIL